MRYERGNRKIYLNQERIPKNNATPIEENCEIDVAESCYHNINNKYKNNYISDKIDKTKNRIKRKESLPYWFEHPESIKKVEATKEEQEEMENRDFLREDDDPIFTPKEQNTVTPEQEDVPLDKTNDILKQINEYLDNEKKKL